MTIAVKKRGLPVTLPSLEFEQGRWATARTTNVEKIADTWRKNPNLVKVFRDSKFGRNEMVLMRKNKLEHILKLIHDLQNAQAAVQLNMSTLFHAVDAMQSIVETREQELPESVKSPMAKMAKLIVNIRSRIPAKILVRSPRRKLQPSPLSKKNKMQVKT